MLSDELSGRSYNKAAQNRSLEDETGRGRGSIEFKMCNVSAVLLGFGLQDACVAGVVPKRSRADTEASKAKRCRLDFTPTIGFRSCGTVEQLGAEQLQKAASNCSSVGGKDGGMKNVKGIFSLNFGDLAPTMAEAQSVTFRK